jgi:cystathionine gamma-lyase
MIERLGKNMLPITSVVRSNLTGCKNGDPLADGPVFASTFHLSGDPSSSPYTYGRYHNPTWTALESTLASLESAQNVNASTLAFASGMAAVMSVFGVTLKAGSIVVLPPNGYYTVRHLIDRFFVPLGILVRLLPRSGNAWEEALSGASLLWLETPTNPELEIWDIRALAEASHRAGALMAVDNTTATALGQNVLALGADFSVTSGTKALTGHSDLLMGYVAVTEEKHLRRLHDWRSMTGSVLGPMEAWLALRSIPTLPLRLKAASESAQALASYLIKRDDVVQTMYPGLESHPDHCVAVRQMSFFGPVVSFILESSDRAESFLKHSCLLTEATSFGGVSSTAERRGRWSGDAIDPGFIRVSVGCEAVEDLLADVENALDESRTPVQCSTAHNLR